MGLFDRMFGRGASEEDKAKQRFEELKKKYQTVLTLADQEGLQFHNLHVQDNRLVIRATAPSLEAANKVWDQMKLVNPSLDDINADIPVRQSAAPAPQPSGSEAGAQEQPSQSYTVKAGDTLSKISRQFYGDANEYMRIFYANRDKLRDPDKIQVGQQLVIPPDTDD